MRIEIGGLDPSALDEVLKQFKKATKTDDSEPTVSFKKFDKQAILDVFDLAKLHGFIAFNVTVPTRVGLTNTAARSCRQKLEGIFGSSLQVKQSGEDTAALGIQFATSGAFAYLTSGPRETMIQLWQKSDPAFRFIPPNSPVIDELRKLLEVTVDLL